MADKTFEGYTITSADISSRVEDRKYRGKYLYEVYLTLDSLGDNRGDSVFREIWERVFNNLTERDLATRKEELERSRQEPEDFKYLLPWNRIECRYNNLVPVVYVFETSPMEIERHCDILKKLVKDANALAQKEIDEVNKENKQLGEEREKLKQLKWDDEP